MISRRLAIGLLGAFALYATPVALALSPEARNAKLDETLRALIEGRSTPGVAVLILQNGRPVYSRSVGVREVGSAELDRRERHVPPRLDDEGRHFGGGDDPC